MRLLLLSLIAAFAVTTPAAAATRIADPAAFIQEVYAALIQEQNRPTEALGESYEPPDDIYTPALAKAFSEERRDRGDEIGRLDFFYWVNGQDWQLTDVVVTERSVWRRPDRRAVTAEFKNFGSPQVVVFYFQKAGGRWLIDEVESIAVPDGEETGSDWTLSVILKYAREEE